MYGLGIGLETPGFGLELLGLDIEAKANIAVYVRRE